MPGARRSVAPLLAALLGAVAPFAPFPSSVRSAWAQEGARPESREGYTPITPSGFQRLSPQAAHGRKLTLAWVKFLRMFEDQLKVVEGKTASGRTRSHLTRRDGSSVLLVRDAALRKKLSESKDSDGNQLTPRQSNVQVFGMAYSVKGSLVLVVDRVHLLESFPALFSRMHKALPEGEAQKRIELARTIRSTLDYYPEDLAACQPIIDALRAEARAIQYKLLPALPSGAETWLELGLQHRDVDLVTQVWNHPEVEPALRERAEDLLRNRLDARLYLGAWYPLAELKRTLGFALDASGAWVPATRQALLSAAEREKRRLGQNQPRRQVTEAILAQAASNGEVLRGQTKEMVAAACRKLLGAESAFPARVDRIRERVSNQDLVFELWVMRDGLQIFFCNDWVTEKVEPSAAQDSGLEAQPQTGQ